MNHALRLEKSCSKVLLATLNASTESYTVQGSTIFPHEIADPEGLLPLFVHVAEQSWIQAFGGKPRTALRRRETALLDFVSEFPTNGDFSTAWFAHAVEMHLASLRQEARAKASIELEGSYRNLHTSVETGMYELRPVKQ